MNQDTILLSKFISLVLRHRPEIISIGLDNHGWCDVDELVSKMNQHGKLITNEQLQEIIINDTKQRFSYSDDKKRIRANQGHTVCVDLELQIEMPPEFLYHGTIEKYIKSIMQNGLQKKQRQHVHLSDEINTAVLVGKRRGEPIVLKIYSGKMFNDGFHFYKSKNNVWLCDFVPKEYIQIL